MTMSVGDDPWGDVPAPTIPRRPGQSAQEMADAKARERPLGTVIDRVLGRHNEEQAWRKGARGEARIGRFLDRRLPGFVIRHDLPIGDRANIDHLVAGPTGVFTLNTKNHQRSSVWVGDGIVMVDGQKKRYIRNSQWEAREVRRVLGDAVPRGVEVEPVIVVISKTLKIAGHPPVSVVAADRVVRWIRSRPVALSPESIEVLRRAIEFWRA